MWQNLDPAPPVFITKRLQTFQDTYGNILENIIFISENLRFWKLWNVDDLTFRFFDFLILKFIFSNFVNLRFSVILDIWFFYNLKVACCLTFTVWKFEIFEFQITVFCNTFEIWAFVNFENMDSCNCEKLHRERMKPP